MLIITYATPEVSFVIGVQGFQRPVNHALNKKQMKNVVRAILMSGLVFSLIGLPVLDMAVVPAIQSLENVLPGSMGLEVTHSGYFLEYYFKHWSYPSKSAWIYFLVGLGLSYGISAAIAGLLVAAGWITVAVAESVLVSTGTGIVIAGAIAAF